MDNLSLGSYKSFISMFPKGVYKSVSWFGDEQDEYVFKSILILKIDNQENKISV